MILKGINQDNIQIGDLSNSTHMSISKDVEGHIIKMLTEKGYDDPLGSGLRECVSNAVDSVKEAGKTDPVLVTIKRNGNNQELEIEDKGLGLDEEGFKKYIMGIGESTKRDKPELLGGYGLGSKAFLAYTSSYTYTCRKDGIERKYLIFKGTQNPQDSLVYQKPTTECNGVTVNVTLNNSFGESLNCINKIKEQLSYLDNIYYDISGFDNTYNIYRSEHFEFSDLSAYKEMHISLRGIYYKIDWSRLRLKPITVPVGLKFDNYNDLVPILNRESIQWDEPAIAAVKSKIKLVADYFVEKYNETVKEFDTFLEAYPYINNSNYNVIIQETTFCINTLIDHASIPRKNIEVKGIEYMSPEFYHNNYQRLFNEFKPVAYYTHSGIWKREKPYYDTNIEKRSKEGKKCVLVEDTPTYAIKEFLCKKYGRNTVFYTFQSRRLGVETNVYTRYTFTDYDAYYGVLGLKTVQRSKWRDMIKEWQYVRDQIVDKYLINEKDVESSEEFNKFLEDKKIATKEKRRLGKLSGLYKSLNKDKTTDITLATGREHKYSSSLVFEKAAHKISELYKRPYLTMYLVKEEVSDDLFYIYKALKGKIAFCIVGEREEKYLKDLHNFKPINKMTKTKPFQRLSSSILIKRLLTRIPTNKVAYVTAQFPEWNDLHDRLFKYYTTHFNTTLLISVENAILEQAKEHNAYDSLIMGDYNRMSSIIDKFYFLELLQPDTYYESEELKKSRKKLISSIILLQKYQEKEMELVPKIPDEILQELYVKEEEPVLI